MKKSKFTEAQIASALRQSETGTRIDVNYGNMGFFFTFDDKTQLKIKQLF
jgi:hypothetical protein